MLELREKKDLIGVSADSKRAAWDRIHSIAEKAQSDPSVRGDLESSRFNVLFRYLREFDHTQLDSYAFEMQEIKGKLSFAGVPTNATACVLKVSFNGGGSKLRFPVALKYEPKGCDMILAIDDDESRYDELRRLLAGTGVELIIACCPERVQELLNSSSLRGILLDYDLDICCSNHKDLKGIAYIPDILKSQVPVIVVSANRTGGHLLYATLTKDAAAPVYYAPASDTYSPEYVWLGWLWREGALL